MPLRILALAVVASLSVAGCDALGAAQGGQLEGVTWQLSTYVTDDARVPVPGDVAATATFASGQVSGTNGCNSYSGPYQASGSSLSVGPLMSTLMGCGPVQSAIESAFMGAFQDAASYTVTSTQLTIYDASGAQTLTFTPQAAVTLVGTPWNVVNYNNGNQATVSVEAGSVITLQFAAEGSVSGNASCNEYHGSFTTDGDTVTVGPLATTRMACQSDQLGAQETQYLTALQNAATYDITNGTLTIRDAAGASQVIATPMALDAP